MSRDISHFIANLNSLDPIDSPSFSGEHSNSPNHPQSSSNSNIKNEDDELSIFANTQFFDFDMGRSTDIAVTVDDLLMQQEKLLQNPKGKPHPDENGGSSSNSNGNFYGGFHNGLHHINQYPSHQLPGSSGVNSAGAIHPSSSSNQPPPPPPTNNHNDLNPVTAFDFSSLQQFSIANELPPHSIHHSPSLSGVATPLQQPPSLHGTPIVSLDSANAKLNGYNNGTIKPSSTTTTSSVTPSITPSAAHKRKSSTTTGVTTSKPLSRSSTSTDTSESPNNEGGVKVVEEDKRRRNTAASARFRIKKKIREQEMERNARDLLEKVQQLETKVMQLEMENRWLKNLVVEKNEARDVTELLNMRNRILGKGDELDAKHEGHQ